MLTASTTAPTTRLERVVSTLLRQQRPRQVYIPKIVAMNVGAFHSLATPYRWQYTLLLQRSWLIEECLCSTVEPLYYRFIDLFDSVIFCIYAMIIQINGWLIFEPFDYFYLHA